MLQRLRVARATVKLNCQKRRAPGSFEDPGAGCRGYRGRQPVYCGTGVGLSGHENYAGLPKPQVGRVSTKANFRPCLHLSRAVHEFLHGVGFRFCLRFPWHLRFRQKGFGDLAKKL